MLSPGSLAQPAELESACAQQSSVLHSANKFLGSMPFTQLQGQPLQNLFPSDDWWLLMTLPAFAWCALYTNRQGRYCSEGALRSCGVWQEAGTCTGCRSCACSPDSSQWAACTWGTAWCAPGSNSGSRSLRCSSGSTYALLHSPPAEHHTTYLSKSCTHVSSIVYQPGSSDRLCLCMMQAPGFMKGALPRTLHTRVTEWSPHHHAR